MAPNPQNFDQIEQFIGKPEAQALHPKSAIRISLMKTVC